MGKLQELKTFIEESEDNEVSEAEILEGLTQYVPERLVYIEKAPQSSPERLQYLKEYHKYRKLLAQIKDKDNIEKQKIEKAKQRKSGYCYKCKSMSEIINPQVKIEQKRGRSKKSLIIESICSKCKVKMRTWGGSL